MYDLAGLMERCESFIREAHISIKFFCRKANIERETFYELKNGDVTPSQQTVEKIEYFLSSAEAKDLLIQGAQYPPLYECVRLTGLSKYVISRLCTDGIIDCLRSSGGHINGVNIGELRRFVNMKNPGRIYFESEQNPKLLSFGDLGFDLEETWKPMLSQNNDSEIFFSDRHEYANQYWISNKGRVYNATTRNVLGANPDRDGYIAVNLEKFDENGNIVLVTRTIHSLVAYFFAPHNDLFRGEIHHINGKKQDNRSCNLLWCTPEEHDECHRLMKSDKKKYREYVKQIQKENKSNRGNKN